MLASNSSGQSPRMSLLSAELDGEQFRTISRFVHDVCGIYLKPGKEALVRSRLMKRLRVLGMQSFAQYMQFLESEKGAAELSDMIDVLTTNKTSFFREMAHFDFLRTTLLPQLKKKRLRFWTAASSSGQEPYSLAIVLREFFPDIETRDVRILATDISTRMLEKLHRGVYAAEDLQDLAPALLNKHFHRVSPGSPAEFQIKDATRALVFPARLNLIDPWPMKGPFEVIFCRNVMIYFDKPTQQRLIGRFWNLLAPGGYLFVGHAEGLSSISHRFKYVQPAVYLK